VTDLEPANTCATIGGTTANERDGRTCNRPTAATLDHLRKQEVNVADSVASQPVVGKAETGVVVPGDPFGETLTDRGVWLSAYRGAEQSHRIERLHEIAGNLDNDTTAHVMVLHDHKGELTVLWCAQPTEYDYEQVASAWAVVAEECFEDVVSVDWHTGREYWWSDTLHALPYADYLRTYHWQCVRDRAHANAGFACELCNATARLHVHHRTYGRRGFEWDGDVIVLCQGCHAKFHDKLAKHNGRGV